MWPGPPIPSGFVAGPVGEEAGLGSDGTGGLPSPGDDAAAPGGGVLLDCWFCAYFWACSFMYSGWPSHCHGSPEVAVVGPVGEEGGSDGC
jgi:hypothetical protein